MSKDTKVAMYIEKATNIYCVKELYIKFKKQCKQIRNNRKTAHKK